MKKGYLSLIAASVALSSLAGCSIVDKSYDTVKRDMGTLKDSIDRNQPRKASAIETFDDIWLGGDAFRVSEAERAPSLLQRSVSFKQLDPVSVSELVTMLSIDLGIQIVLTEDAIEFTQDTSEAPSSSSIPDAAGLLGEFAGGAENPIFGGAVNSGTVASDIRFTLDYKGTVSGLLDVIAGKTGLFWRFEKGQIVIKRFETVTYLVDIVSGSTTYSAEMMSDIGGGEGGSSQHSVTSEFEPENSWSALDSALKTILSRGGKVAYAESTGSVVVTDTPHVQRRVEQYIKSLNSVAGRQISVRADVFEITSDENGDFDTNIMALYDWKGDLTVGLDGQSLSFGLGGGTTQGENRFSADTSASLQMLRQNKNASLVTSSTIYAMNGQPTPFQQMDEVGYLAEVSVTQIEGQEPQRALTPGKTSQGFSMMLMPRILSNGKVMMTFAVDSSRINSIDSYGNETQGEIQLPNRSSNKYQQVVTVGSGQPLMIAGLERTESFANINSKFGRHSWLLGGSQAGGKRKVMTMIILTPYIMQK